MEGVPALWMTYFRVEDVDLAVARAQELGAQVHAPAFDVAGVGRLAVLADPNGAAFSLMAAESPARRDRPHGIQRARSAGRDLETQDVEAGESFYSGVFGWRYEDLPTPDGRSYAKAFLDMTS